MKSFIYFSKKLLLVQISVFGSMLSYAQMVDSLATPETKALFYNLKTLSGQGIMFGHQDATAYGINQDGSLWSNKDFKSDVHEVCGDYPAVYGFELGWLELDSANNLDNVNFERMKYWIKQAYKRGGIITISWHANNPANDESSWNNKDNPVSKILPGGSLFLKYKNWLDRVAGFLKDLKDDKNKPIPVIFRPYHENTGNWFWWGSESDKDEYIELWHYTVKYYRDTLSMHNLIYAYSPINVYTSEDYLDRYPGDDYIDLIGLDFYDATKKEFLPTLQIISEIASKRNKICALTETGDNRQEKANNWTKNLLNVIKNDSLAKKLSFLLVWRNADLKQFFAPYPGHPIVPDFIDFYNDPFTIFNGDLPKLYKSIDPNISFKKRK